MTKQEEPPNRPRRIFIGPSELAGYYSSLNAGFKKIGQPAEFIELWGHPFGYEGADRLPTLLRWRASIRSEAKRMGAFLSVILTSTGKLLFLLWFVQAIFRYDAFIFSFGRSLLPMNRDLKLLKVLGKKIVCNLSHGSEARPPYIDGAWYSIDGQHPGFEELRVLTRETKRRVRRCENNATWIIGAPYSSSPFLTKPFVNLFSMGIPFAIRDQSGQPEGNPEMDSGVSRCFRLLHSPSHPFAKGTEIIRQTLGNLIAEGFDIELVELQGVPNAKVLQEIVKSDFVIDQVFSDIPMAGFALEAAAHGKPAVVAGEHLEELKGFVPADMWPPTIICKPNELEQAIRNLLLRPNNIQVRGAEAQGFVEKKWNAHAVAERYLSLFRNEVPEDWLLVPSEVPFPRGVGIPNNEAVSNIDAMISTFGRSSLGIRD